MNIKYFLARIVFLGISFFYTDNSISHEPISASAIEIIHDDNLSKNNPAITNLVIVVHGFLRKPQKYYDIVKKVFSANNQIKKSLIIAPYFASPEDNVEGILWDHAEWSKGEVSINYGNISSFEIIDELIAQLIKNGHFPNLKNILLIGHSAGGQFVQRYAAANSVENQFSKIKFRYIVANPSSYMYLDKTRLNFSSLNTSNPEFNIPETSSCKNYNDYKYGMNNLNRYLKQKSVEQIKIDYLKRDVIYLIGELDNAEEHYVDFFEADPKAAFYLDANCEAKLQGNSRFHRALVYKSYLDSRFEGHKHHLVVAPNFSHDINIIGSVEIVNWLKF